MAQYIDKSDVVAEIERRIKILQNNPYENHKTICHLDSLKQFFNTFEVKEKREFESALEAMEKENVKPKFNIGDWIYHEISGNTFHINRIENHSIELNPLYISDEGATISFGRQNDWRLWSIKDAKDGDVLCRENGWTCIFKALDNNTNTFSSYCFIDSFKWFCNTGGEAHTLDKAFIKAYNGEIHPATKEQCDTLMKTMADAGYTFDFENKKLMKVKSKFNIDDWIIHNEKKDIAARVISITPLTYEILTDDGHHHIIAKDVIENNFTFLFEKRNKVSIYSK